MISEPCTGYFDKETVMLDLDDTSKAETIRIAREVADRYGLEGILVLKSSQDNHHVIFDRPVTWLDNVEIVATICKITKKQKLSAWFLNICIRRHPILRTGWKGDKPPPRVVYKWGRQDQKIAEYLRYREISLSPLG